MTPDELIRARRRWALALIQRAPEPPPTYGTREWVALPDGPLKVAAVVIAAERTAADDAELEVTVSHQVELLRRAYKAGQDDGWADRCDDHRERWKGGRAQPDPWLAGDVEREFQEWVEGGGADDVA